MAIVGAKFCSKLRFDGFSVDLAGGEDRKDVPKPKVFWDRKRRKQLAKFAQKSVGEERRIDGTTMSHFDHGLNAVAPDGIGDSKCAGRSNPGCAEQSRFDRLRVDVLAARDQHVVPATHHREPPLLIETS